MLINYIDYQKLEKVEMAGLMGRWYSSVIDEVSLVFSKDLEKMSSISYDPLDMLNVESNAFFLKDYEIHMTISNDIDNRLAKICKISFENSDHLMATQKVNFRPFYLNWYVLKLPNFKITLGLRIIVINNNNNHNNKTNDKKRKVHRLHRWF